ncbi:uncharacterized protein N0V89_002268 [Didymosphaeria variabile]|uniref:Mitochondrial resolvase Ydc2 catalytic domain-containing protein n=1 Tax=Didymosphaeria variabile TaxID=1932322 RepID=A0A9W8XUH5_9PLEO|nr:uncharacterized protein N0V89_002268 [Didymosphaeria variabile]KAJ4357692.1 hypothetical protein N0V89_002268 [Didymosphaeria variabile]
MSPANSFFPLFLTKKGPTVRAMQEVLQRIGEATTGTKDVVQNRLLAKALCNKMPCSILRDGRDKKPRILSIDMGIKNLAYCVADVEKPTPTRDSTHMNIRTWCRLDLSEAFRDYSLGGDQKSLAKEAALEGREDEDLYTPQSLSRMAYWFLRKILSDWSPDIILIERQRWRSSGSPTIQQWTVRVNTLEATMWAVMETLKSERMKFLEWQMYAVDPKRVGHFWLNGVTPAAEPKSARASKKKASKSSTKSEEDEEDIGKSEDEEAGSTKKLTRGKAEKKAKIQLLRSWLDSDNPSTTLSASSNLANSENAYPNISFTFSHKERMASPTGYGADATRQALLYATDKPFERARRTAYYKAYVSKVDDITDCFLQAAAWVAWGENLRNLRPEVNELKAQVEGKLGRKMNVPWHLADAVKELQEKGPETNGPDGEVVKKTSNARKTKMLKTKGAASMATLNKQTKAKNKANR